MNTEKRLIIHAGGGKTGSTAIQSYCELHVDQLLECGFSYQNVEGVTCSYQFSSGNGRPLFDALQTSALSEIDIDRVVTGYLGECNNAICSSEYFEALGVEGWKKLIQSAQRLKILLTVVFFIRNTIPFLLSAYDQAIKHHGEFRTFEEWSSNATVRWSHADALRRMEGDAEALNLKVISFDSCKKTLLDCFFTVIDCPLKPTVSNSQIVNRSLTAVERQALRNANKSLGYIYSAEISELLISSAPEVLAEPAYYSKSWLEKTVEKYQEDLLWVNNRFFDCRQVVEILPVSNSDIKSCLPGFMQQTKAMVSENILQWAINKLTSVQHETRLQLVSRLQNAIENGLKVIYPEQPLDFDPLAYLVLNPDVLFAEIDPAEHYFCSGRSEGRKYSFNFSGPNLIHPKLKHSDNRYLVLASALKQLNMQFNNICRNVNPVPVSHQEKICLGVSDITGEAICGNNPLYFRVDNHVSTRTACCLTVVLGMHRSGTSAITRALQVFDIPLGDHLMQAASDNERGFWEDLDINALNMELLDVIESGWDHALPLQLDRLGQLEKTLYFNKAVNLLCEKTNGVSQFAFKDPRLAQLLPFWKAVFDYCGFSVRYVISLRNPFSVCRSLKERDGFQHGKSYALWVGHVLNSLRETQGCSRVLVDYDLLMEQPDVELHRISQTFNLAIAPEHKAEFINAFLEKSLRHSTATYDDIIADPNAFPLVGDIYRELSAIAADKVSFNGEYLAGRLEKWGQEYECLLPFFRLIDQGSAQTAILTKRLKEHELYTQQLRQERSSLDKSFLDLIEDLVEKDKQLKSARHLLAERERHIDSLTQKMHITAQCLDELGQTVKEQEQSLADMKESILQKENLANEITSNSLLDKQRLSGVEQESKQLKQRLMLLDRLLEERNQQLVDLQLVNGRLEQSTIEQEQRLETLNRFSEEGAQKLIELQEAHSALKLSHMGCLAKLKDQELIVRGYTSGISTNRVGNNNVT